MIRGAFLATLVLALLVGAGCGGGGRESYVKHNEALFRSLPTFPGATKTSESSAPYRTEEDGPVRGYTTTFHLRLPANAAAADVAAFYSKRLQPSWRVVERLSGPVLNLRRGRAALSVNLEGARGRELELTVDYDRGEKFRS